MDILASSAFALTVLGWVSYVPVSKVPSLRHTMWPTWVIFAMSVILGGVALIRPDAVTVGLFAATFVSFLGFFVMYLRLLRQPRAEGRPEIGRPLPTMEFVTETGGKISNADFVGKGPVLLIFFRGFWCISCADELRNLGEVRKALKSKGGEIIAVTTEKTQHLANGRKRFPELPCVLASDTEGKALKQLHLLHETMEKVGKLLAVPANVLVDKDGVVRWVHYASVAMDRPDPRAVLKRVLSLGSNEQLLTGAPAQREG